jgi:S-DNA-T family DNA segregation ATPase FtsK/SpoIIIE
MTRIPFHRPTRALPPPLEGEQIVLPPPPQDGQQPGAAGSMWLSLLLPLMSSISMAAYMIIYHNLMLIILGISFVVFSVAVTVFVRYQMRDATRKAKNRQRGRYMQFLADVKQTARVGAANQRLNAAWLHPSPERLWAIARRRRRVWERRATDEDFLTVRLGLGRGPLSSPVQLGTRGDPMAEYDEKIYAEARKVVSRFSTVGRQPALLDLGRAGVVSLLGPPDQTRAVARALLCQVAVLHAPDDVAIALYTGGEQDWDWVKWLPHTYEPDATGTAGVVPMVAADFEGLADALEAALARAEDERTARSKILSQARRSEPRSRLVVVLDGYDPEAEWARSPVVNALLGAAGPELGITVVCLVAGERDEPSRTQVRVRLAANGGITFEGRRDNLYSKVSRAFADRPDPVLCLEAARALAPLSLSNEPDRVLTQITPLMEMLGAEDLSNFDPTAVWRKADDERVLRVPIGVGGDGEPVELDLKESAQDGMGPHGLIVGATGSGKSELLRTLVTGLAMTHSPELLSLVLVDFKGGATFAGLTELPHVAGLITNLADDLSLVDRVRDALHGEQQRRQKMLRDAGNVDSLRDYQLRQAAGHLDVDGRPLEPLPYLLVIVDEFGELLSQRSDFIDLFVQIGRVGRSLGMHLLLATQRLEEGRLRGLESHLSYRICLRTFSAGESRAVIGTQDAYQLPPVPGSAYLKVDESVYRRFRVAHVSGPYESPAEIAGRQAGTPPLALYGLREPAPPEPEVPVAAAAPVGGPTSMRVAVERLCRFGQPVHQVWLPPLPAVLPLDALLGPLAVDPERGWQATMWPGRGALRFPVGLIDLPLQQVQQPLLLDFAGRHGNVALVGAPQSGKSTLLRSALLAMILTHTPEEAQLYCIDFGGGSLYPLAAAPHVGGVAGRRDAERARRILAETTRLVAYREQLFGDLGIDSVAGFRGQRRAGRLAPGTNAAEVFLVIDNWGALRGELDDAEEQLVQIASRGLGVGVHVILTSPRWADVRMVLRDSIGTRLELRLNDPADSEVSRPAAKQLVEAPPGRGVAPPGVLYQAVVPRLDGQQTMEGLADALEETLTKVAASWSGAVAPPVRMLPDRVSAGELGGDRPGEPGVAIGVGDYSLEPVHLDLNGLDPHFLVFGDSGAGKSTFLRTWLAGMVAKNSAWEARFMIVDYRRSLLDAVPEPYIGAYAGDPNSVQEYADQLAGKLAERLPPAGISARELRERSWWTGPELYLVVDDYDLVGGGRTSPLAGLADFVAQAPEIGFHVVLARRVAGVSRSLMSDPLVSRVKELGSGGLLLSGDPREGVLLGDERASVLVPGRGLLVQRRQQPALVQIGELDPVS